MKTIGLIGGMSWESTIPYYRILNETIRDTLGGYHSAKIILTASTSMKSNATRVPASGIAWGKHWQLSP
jgi:aspartate/glutamate racemase